MSFVLGVDLRVGFEFIDIVFRFDLFAFTRGARTAKCFCKFWRPHSTHRHSTPASHATHTQTRS